MFMNYRIDRNNFYQKPKNSNVYTPPEVSQFIFNLLKDKIDKEWIIFDPCCGTRNLLEPWEKVGYPSYGIDLDQNVPADKHWDFLKDESQIFKLFPIFFSGKKEDYKLLVLCNPPFNGYGKQLGSEVWLDKIIELFGKEIPIVLFVPAGFRLNLTLKSKRHGKFKNEEYPPISSIITLPKNIFAGVTFHSEILIFNLPNLKPHYFYHEKP